MSPNIQRALAEYDIPDDFELPEDDVPEPVKRVRPTGAERRKILERRARVDRMLSGNL